MTGEIKEFMNNKNTIKLSDGYLVAFHDQGCSEDVYADFTALEDTTFEPKKLRVGKIALRFKKESGFTINGYFVPCYNIQNGYYSDELDLYLLDKNFKTIKVYYSIPVKDNIDW